MNLDEFDQSRYDNRLYDDFKIVKKKTKLNSEPQSNLLSSKPLERKESGHDSTKSKMEEEKTAVSSTAASHKAGLSLHKRFSDSSSTHSNRDQKNDSWGSNRPHQPDYGISRSSSQPMQSSQPGKSMSIILINIVTYGLIYDVFLPFFWVF